MLPRELTHERKHSEALKAGGARVTLWRLLNNRLRARHPESCSVYGSSAAAHTFLRALGKNGIHGSAFTLCDTKYHVVVMENDFDTLAFYTQYLKHITQRKIILMLNESIDLTGLKENVQTISIAEIAAALFWMKHAPSPTEKMAFIGEDVFISALMRQGLCMNLYSTAQCIRYHIWGQSYDRYVGMGKISMDKVTWQSKPWSQEIAALMTMGRIILCFDDDKNEEALRVLRAIPGCPPIYVRQGCDAGIPMDNHLPKVISFGDGVDIYNREIVLNETLLKDAKALNEYYRQRHGGKSWEQLETHKRLSSCSSAFYFPVLRKLYRAGMEFEVLSELEHIRWARFHYLRGWKYGPVRNDAEKIHPSLIPYQEMAEEEKQKDRKNVAFAIEHFS